MAYFIFFRTGKDTEALVCLVGEKERVISKTAVSLYFVKNSAFYLTSGYKGGIGRYKRNSRNKLTVAIFLALKPSFDAYLAE